MLWHSQYSTCIANGCCLLSLLCLMVVNKSLKSLIIFLYDIFKLSLQSSSLQLWCLSLGFLQLLQPFLKHSFLNFVLELLATLLSIDVKTMIYLDQQCLLSFLILDILLDCYQHMNIYTWIYFFIMHAIFCQLDT